MSVTSRDLRVQRAKLQDRQQELVDRAESENRNLSAEEKAEFQGLHEDQNVMLERAERLETLENTRADLESVASAENGGSRLRVMPDLTKPPSDQDDHNRLIMAYLRRGEKRMAPSDLDALGSYFNALETKSGPGGGYLVPPAFRAGVVEALKQYGGMRQVATVITTSEGQDLPFATDDDTGNEGEILAEGDEASEQDLAFGTRTLKAYVYSSKVVRVSVNLLNDSAFNLAGHLSKKFAQRVGRITNRHFTTGTGANQPMGITLDAPNGVTAAGQSAVTWDELIDLEHSVDPAYRTMPGVGYMFNDTTLRELKQIKDGEGRPLWTVSVREGEPDRINGYRYVINQDMPSMTTGLRAILFGDFSAYHIRDVDELMVMRLEELYALRRQVAFVAFSRHDGGLIDAGQGPVKHLVMA
jgi:HK97 family phage major capsid protein